MEFAQHEIFIWMSQFAYQPLMVYTAVVLMMLLSAFGLPLPEEVTLLSTGLLAFMGANPDLFPPPYPGAPVVNPTEAAIVAALAVFGADFLIYWIGRRYGRRLVTHPRMSRFFSAALLERAESFVRKYGMLATGIFRFTPGVRFPGHLLCGILRFSPWKFALVDGLAVLISVPTQVLLIAHYGEHILGALKQFKMVVFGVLGALLIVVIAIKLRDRARARQLARAHVAPEAILNQAENAAEQAGLDR
ncbi:MAG: DedA family protein [Bdellovibrionaceae bacterium]|nr:DedA family protein [Pseudobdellovibrionaceae bacterium]